MKQAPKVAMSPGEIAIVIEMRSGGKLPSEIAAALGRHERTIRRVLRDGQEMAKERARPRRRAAMASEAREALRRAALGRNDLRPPHVTAARWSDDWFDQQQMAFAEAMGRAHPDVHPCDASRTLLAHQRITDAQTRNCVARVRVAALSDKVAPAPHGAGVADGLSSEVRQKATRGGS
jgi:hypothetical protein